MKTPLLFYAKFLGLFIVLAMMVSFNFAAWGIRRHPQQPVWYVAGARSERGPALFAAYGCGTCHSISGVRAAAGTVGPRLDRVKDQIYLAGTLPNTPPNLVAWLQNPQAVRPRTAMPNLGISDEDARDIAAYLYAVPEGVWFQARD